jgi:ribosomal-protein-alanine N-acetyltransferase
MLRQRPADPVDSSQPIPLRIEPMRRRDLRAVLKIEVAVYPGPWSRGVFLSELDQGSTRRYRVAKVHKELVGYVGLLLSPDEAHVTTIAVDPGWQGHQIGARLLLEAIALAMKAGKERVGLEVRVSNEPAKQLYRRFGFMPVGVRPNYYPEVGEDAYVMFLEDISSEPVKGRLAQIADEVSRSVAI